MSVRTNETDWDWETETEEASSQTDDDGPPRGGLDGLTYAELEDAINDADQRTHQFAKQGDKETADKWSDRWIELAEELDRREAAPKATTTATRARLEQPNRESGKGPTFDTFGNYGPFPRSVFRNDELTSDERLALLVLADAWHPKARYVKISIREISKRMAVTRSSAHRAVSKLEAKAWITKQPGSGHGANRFRFTKTVREREIDL